MPVTARNVSFATVEGIGAVMAAGTVVAVGGQTTRELIHHVTVLERPLERFIFVPERRNDAFAQIAEAIWVVAGRDDVSWLSRYLPRAGDFSGDGQTWRGAYGPRLRHWRGENDVDQIDQVRRILKEDGSSRRAVMSLFDPNRDLKATSDIPCNNWLSWIVRDNQLHLAVAVRSNDALWGFSGANAFEWSVLHELLAHWLGVEVGQQTWIASSFHVYEQHWARAGRMTDAFHGLTPYDFGLRRAAFRTPWESLAPTLAAWFEAEAATAADPDAPLPADSVVADPFLIACLQAVRVRWGAEAWGEARLRAELAALPPTDVSAAVWEHFTRSRPDRLVALRHAGLAEFFAACAERGISDGRFKESVKRLQARKDRAYRSAWKRRGELVSALPNVARKVDRLEVFLREGHHVGDEAVLNTAVNLYVYATKYRLLIEDRVGASDLLPLGSPTPYSDHDENFEWLVDLDGFEGGDADLGTSIRMVVDIFEELWRLAAEDESLATARDLADRFREAARQVVTAAARGRPVAVRAFVAAEAVLWSEGEQR